MKRELVLLSFKREDEKLPSIRLAVRAPYGAPWLPSWLDAVDQRWIHAIDLIGVEDDDWTSKSNLVSIEIIQPEDLDKNEYFFLEWTGRWSGDTQSGYWLESDEDFILMRRWS